MGVKTTGDSEAVSGGMVACVSSTILDAISGNSVVAEPSDSEKVEDGLEGVATNMASLEEREGEGAEGVKGKIGRLEGKLKGTVDTTVTKLPGRSSVNGRRK